MRELLALAEREQELRAKVDEVGREQRCASEELAAVLPEAVARKLSALPLSRRGDLIRVAIADPRTS